MNLYFFMFHKPYCSILIVIFICLNECNSFNLPNNETLTFRKSFSNFNYEKDRCLWKCTILSMSNVDAVDGMEVEFTSVLQMVGALVWKGSIHQGNLKIMRVLESVSTYRWNSGSDWEVGKWWGINLGGVQEASLDSLRISYYILISKLQSEMERWTHYLSAR